jgi:hypothetical protein
MKLIAANLETGDRIISTNKAFARRFFRFSFFSFSAAAKAEGEV